MHKVYLHIDWYILCMQQCFAIEVWVGLKPKPKPKPRKVVSAVLALRNWPIALHDSVSSHDLIT